MKSTGRHRSVEAMLARFGEKRLAGGAGPAEDVPPVPTSPTLAELGDSRKPDSCAICDRLLYASRKFWVRQGKKFCARADCQTEYERLYQADRRERAQQLRSGGGMSNWKGHEPWVKCSACELTRPPAELENGACRGGCGPRPPRPGDEFYGERFGAKKNPEPSGSYPLPCKGCGFDLDGGPHPENGCPNSKGWRFRW